MMENRKDLPSLFQSAYLKWFNDYISANLSGHRNAFKVWVPNPSRGEESVLLKGYFYNPNVMRDYQLGNDLAFRFSLCMNVEAPFFLFKIQKGVNSPKNLAETYTLDSGLEMMLGHCAKYQTLYQDHVAEDYAQDKQFA